jgi:hypothetical protein
MRLILNALKYVNGGWAKIEAGSALQEDRSSQGDNFSQVFAELSDI